MTNEQQQAQVVLIIDDSRENRILLSSQLSLEGYQTLQAAGGKEGIDTAISNDPDIILLDVMMPDMSGFEVCQTLKENKSTHLIPIIMVTALREVEARIEGKKAGADDFLSRPYVREELLVRVRTLIQLKHARVHLEEERNRLELLYEITQAISKDLDLESIVATTITETQKALGANKGNIILLDESGAVTHKFLIRANASLEIGDQIATEVMDRGLGGWLIQHQRGDIINDISEDERWVTLPDDSVESGAAIGVPLIAHTQTIGVLILNHPQTNYFKSEHLTLLQTIAGTTTTAIQNAYFFSEVSEEREKLSAILAQASDVIITTDQNRVISRINHAAENLFNLKTDEVTNQDLTNIPELWPLISLFEQDDSYAGEVILNNQQIFYASLSQIKDVGYAVVLQDITEMKRMEELRIETERLEKERVKETFSRYMGPSLVEHVLENVPNLMARRERREAVVMFADIRDFTRFTRSNEPNEVVERLNEFFTKMTEIVYSFDGIIFELTGDEILVGFNAPFDQDDAPTRALETAISMHQRFNQLRQELFGNLSIGFGMGVGIDLGEVVVGNVGAETRMTFRMVGDAVNIAHRLVDLASDHEIVISEKVYENINPKSALVKNVQFESLGPLQIKGKDEPQMVYSISI
ncbi:MAG: adenylate/guanylate cyclase domain-containing protein [Chloroflexota bacterium]